MTYAYFNETFLPIEEVRISPLDRGFLFGDSVYEVIPVYEKKPFLFEEHILRLKRSLEETRISRPKQWENLEEIIGKLVELNRAINQSIYAQISRGVDINRSHIAEEDIEPTLFIMSSDLTLNPYRYENNIEGIKVSLQEDPRWKRCDIKATTLLPNIIALNEAVSSGSQDVIFYRNQEVTEGASSNIFLVFQGEVFTPPQSKNILTGVTRNHVINLLKDLNLTISERVIYIEDLFEAEEIWLTSSTKEIQPVSEINKKKLSVRSPEKALWRRVLENFHN